MSPDLVPQLWIGSGHKCANLVSPWSFPLIHLLPELQPLLVDCCYTLHSSTNAVAVGLPLNCPQPFEELSLECWLLAPIAKGLASRAQLVSDDLSCQLTRYEQIHGLIASP
jgi:hypothetical protein